VTHARLLIAALVLAVLPLCLAHAANPPADLCSLLTSSDVSKTLGSTYPAPSKSEAPRPFAGTATGADCYYKASGGPQLWFRAYSDPSPAAATELFHRLAAFYAPPSPVSGLADEAYFDKHHGLHVRKGQVRYFLQLDVSNFSAKNQKQLTDLAAHVAAQL
jgi:hypothetical protein